MTSTTGASAVTYFSFSKIGPKLTAQCPRDCSAQKWEHRPNSDGVFVRGAQLLCWCQRPLQWFGVAQGALSGTCAVAGGGVCRWNATCELCRMQGELLPCTPQLLHACSNCAMKRLLVPFLFRAPRCARRNLGGGAGVGSCTDHFGRSFAVLWSTGEPLWSCQQLCRPSWS